MLNGAVWAPLVFLFFLRAMRQIDERYGTYGSDAELCFQANRSGKRVLLLPATRVVHHGRTDLCASERGARDADFKLGIALYIRKRFGIVRGIVFRIVIVLGAFGGPENIPDEALDQGLLDRIRAA